LVIKLKQNNYSGAKKKCKMLSDWIVDYYPDVQDRFHQYEQPEY
jgi:hypothetical protein